MSDMSRGHFCMLVNTNQYKFSWILPIIECQEKKLLSTCIEGNRHNYYSVQCGTNFLNCFPPAMILAPESIMTLRFTGYVFPNVGISLLLASCRTDQPA